MNFLMSALEALPSVAVHPYAIIGYVIVVICWTTLAYKAQRNSKLLSNLEKLPQENRLEALRLEMGSIELKEGLSPEQWIRHRQHLYYFFAFLAACLMLLLLFAIASVHNAKTGVDADERRAVIDLINDIKTKPHFARFFFVNEHDFIDESWLKYDDNDAYYESTSGLVTPFTIVDMFAISRDLSNVIRPSHGTITVRIIDMDQVVIHGKEQTLVTATAEENPLQEITLDIETINVYSAGSSIFGDEIMEHVNNPLIPADIREILQRFNVYDLEVMSFSKVVALGEDFIVLSEPSPDNLIENKRPKGPPQKMALFSRSTPLSLREFTDDCTDLLASIQRWSEKNGVDVKLLEKPYLSRSDFEKRINSEKSGQKNGS